MRYDAFSKCHPIVNFIFFVGAIGFGVVYQHPAYTAAAVILAAVYYLLLTGRRGWKLIAGMIPLFLLLSVINPVFADYGETVLFTVFSHPFTLESLFYGMEVAGIFVLMLIWFGCYSKVLTSDKFICLFGSLIPAVSLLLVMVLRMIPNLQRKASQIIGARKSIGKGFSESKSTKAALQDGITALSALTDWSLEGSIMTADSMRSRGYGTARRTSFQIYTMGIRDWFLLVLIIALAVITMLSGGTEAQFSPSLHFSIPGWGLAAYCCYLLIPSALYAKELLQWHISISRI